MSEEVPVEDSLTEEGRKYLEEHGELPMAYSIADSELLREKRIASELIAACPEAS